MTLNKKLWLIVSLLLIFPLQSKAFLSFCFPISATILFFVLGWPSPVLYEFFPKAISEPILDKGSVDIFVLGYAIDLLLVVLFGYFLDKKRGKLDMSFKRKFIFRLPLYFTIGVILLLAFVFIDPTCKL